jgi:hypothetical protein
MTPGSVPAVDRKYPAVQILYQEAGTQLDCSYAAVDVVVVPKNPVVPRHLCQIHHFGFPDLQKQVEEATRRHLVLLEVRVFDEAGARTEYAKVGGVDVADPVETGWAVVR